ncbi:hypothetical protein cypCar_00022476 [Cyprinus carpio]|nr:hypothetical protein cypCar_00022476 [Cyprinus carpio]
MNKSLAVLILAVLLFKGVDSISLTDEDYEMADKLFTLGAEAFLKTLDNLKGAAEVVMEQKKINKTGTELQDLWISLKEMIKKITAEKEAKGHDHFIISLQEFGMYKGIFKNETVVDFWK